MSVRILVGDCRERMAGLDPDSIDSCVCDPPYHLTSIVKRFGREKPHLEVAAHKDHETIKAPQYKRLSRGFMGQQWDGGDVAFDPATWEAVFRVLKPGAHLIAFSGTRTYHRMACAIEDAGFEIRDQLAWIYGSGFPKSHNQPGGWGTALKPAWEPICLARKPLVGTVAATIAAHGTGAINIDGCRIETADNLNGGAYAENGSERADGWGMQRLGGAGEYQQPLGRWPANIIHDGSEEVLQEFPNAPGQQAPESFNAPSSKTRNAYGERGRRPGGFGNIGADKGSPVPNGAMYGDSGSAARFFYCAKATSEERGEGNNHPTVKPVDLMRWLVRLVTPKGGTVLDPFSGSGSTLVAADAEQFNAIGCELSPDYAAIAEKRVRASAGMFAEVRAA